MVRVGDHDVQLGTPRHFGSDDAAEHIDLREHADEPRPLDDGEASHLVPPHPLGGFRHVGRGADASDRR